MCCAKYLQFKYNIPIYGVFFHTMFQDSESLTGTKSIWIREQWHRLAFFIAGNSPKSPTSVLQSIIFSVPLKLRRTSLGLIHKGIPQLEFTKKMTAEIGFSTIPSRHNVCVMKVASIISWVVVSFTDWSSIVSPPAPTDKHHLVLGVGFQDKPRDFMYQFTSFSVWLKDN